MIDKVIESLRFIVEIEPEKVVIVLLSALVIYFGWNNFNTTISNEVLQNQRNEATLDCTTKIAIANIECQDKITKQTNYYQKRYDAYRDKVEQDNLERIRVWELKYQVVEKRLEDAQNKQAYTEELVRQITNKLK